MRAQVIEAQTADQIDNLGDPTGRLLKAHHLQRAGMNSAARTTLLDALSTAPESVPLLNALGSVQQDLGEYFAAERSYLRALDLCSQTKAETQRVTVLTDLGTLYLDTRQYAKGERVRQELAAITPAFLDRHPTQAVSLLSVLAALEHGRNRDDYALQYYTQALALTRKSNTLPDLDAAAIENNLGLLHLERGQARQAEEFFQSAIQDAEKASGVDDSTLVQPLVNFARCENVIARNEKAEVLARRAVEISTRTFGARHPITAAAMLELANALRKLRRKKEARQLEKQATAALQLSAALNYSSYSVDSRDLAASSVNNPLR
jgi:tetratricopeptide (TPR) repeat protein